MFEVWGNITCSLWQLCVNIIQIVFYNPSVTLNICLHPLQKTGGGGGVPFSPGGERIGGVKRGMDRVGKDESQTLLETMATGERTYCSLGPGLLEKPVLFSLYLRPKARPCGQTAAFSSGAKLAKWLETGTYV